MDSVIVEGSIFQSLELEIFRVGYSQLGRMDLDTVQRWDRTGSYVKGISNTNTTGSNILSLRLVNCEGLILWGFRTSAHSPEDRELTTGLGKAKSQPEILEDPYVAKWFGFEFLILRCGRTRQTGHRPDGGSWGQEWGVATSLPNSQSGRKSTRK